MSDICDVAVIGGGLFGCSIAYHLAATGAGTVQVFERNALGSGATSRAAALVTLARSDETLTRLVMETHRAIAELEDVLGEDLGFRRVGSLHIAATAETAAPIAAQTDILRRLDLSPQTLTVEAARKLCPWLDLKQAELIVWHAADGFIDPYMLASAYIRAAKQRHPGSVTVHQQTEVVRLLTEGGRVVGLETADGVIRAGAVVLAGGAWSALLTAPFGVGVAAAPVRSHYWITADSPVFPTASPVVVLPDAAAYARPEVGGLLFGIRDAVSPWVDPRNLPSSLDGFSFDDDHDGWRALEAGAERFFALCPALSDTPIPHYVSGPSTYTPDGRYLVGPVDELPGLYLATGCCGAGVAASGGIGSAIAGMISGTGSPVDMESFRPDRFGPIDAFSPDLLMLCASARSKKKAG